MPRPRATVPLRRVNIIIPVASWEWLSGRSGELGINVSELLRRLIDEKRLAPPKDKR